MANKKRRVRKYTAPIPAKPCAVYCMVDGHSVAMTYNFNIKLMLIISTSHTSFSSRRKAKKAIWHTLQYWNKNGLTKLDGAHYQPNDFEVREEEGNDILYILVDGVAVPEPDLMKWAVWFENDDNRRVAFLEKDEIRVSTVFLGIAMPTLYEDQEPILFETMVFGGKLDHKCVSYHSLDDAMAGHARICAEVFGDEAGRPE